jgi:hypothetical protein
MTWSASFEGNEFEVEKQFQEVIASATRNNLPAMELVDIGDTANLVRVICMRNRVRVRGSASGQWITYGPEDPRNRFGRISLTIDGVEPYRESE